jgi:hypothetical protein
MWHDFPVVSGAIATSHETVEALLRASKRDHLPLRSTFLQGRGTRRDDVQPGPLADFVRAHRNRTLELYLLVHAVCSGGDYAVARDSRIWARALGLGSTPSALSAVSKSWRWLEARALIRRSRAGRLSRIELLREDGSGLPYGHPANEKDTWYFPLPYEFWSAEERWYRQLSLPAIAALLIACSQPSGFSLPSERAPGWYGISAESLGRGFRELRRAGLLDSDLQRRAAPLAPLGFTEVRRYTLQRPFAHRPRRPR